MDFYYVSIDVVMEFVFIREFIVVLDVEIENVVFYGVLNLSLLEVLEGCNVIVIGEVCVRCSGIDGKLECYWVRYVDEDVLFLGENIIS